MRKRVNVAFDIKGKLEGTVKGAIDALQALLSANEELEDMQLTFNMYTSYDGPDVEVGVHGFRDETQEEERLREALELEGRERMLDFRRRQLEALKIELGEL